MNLAVVLKLPAIFVIENNGYGEGTGADYHCGAKGPDGKPDFAGRARGMGMPAVAVDGHDFVAVYDAMREAAERARAGEGPSAIETRCARFYGHFVGDPQLYRSKAELAAVRAKDPLKAFRERMASAGLLDAAALDAVDAEVLAEIEVAVKAAEAAPFPSVAELETDVYASAY